MIEIMITETAETGRTEATEEIGATGVTGVTEATAVLTGGKEKYTSGRRSVDFVHKT